MINCDELKKRIASGKVDSYDIIQLPHHGKEKQATDIFDAVKNDNLKMSLLLIDKSDYILTYILENCKYFS